MILIKRKEKLVEPTIVFSENKYIAHIDDILTVGNTIDEAIKNLNNAIYDIEKHENIINNPKK